MIIVGGGPVGAELGQAFQRLGTQVTFVTRGDKFLSREDNDASAHLMFQLQKDGVQFESGSEMLNIETVEPGNRAEGILPQCLLTVKQIDEVKQIEFDTIMFATGRRPNVRGLGLEEAKVSYDERDGIFVNKYMQTSNENIFSVGDCLALASSKEEAVYMKGPGLQFTHNSDVMARSIIRNALFFGKVERDGYMVPWSTYTDPEIAHVGKYSWQLDAEGVEYDTYTKFFQRLDRALCESKKGFIKIHTKKGGDKILGATAVGGPAGELICLLTSGMYNGLGLSKIGACVYPYPSWAEGIKHLADQFNKTQVGNTSKTIIQTLLNVRK